MAFNLHWQSLGVRFSWQLVMIMLFLVLLSSPCLTKPIEAPRWETPCSGTAASKADIPFTAPLGITPVNQQHRAISQQAADARQQYIQPLIRKYETKFGLDQTSLNDLATQMETQLFGSLQPNFTSSSQSDRLATLMKGYNDLSHLAIFMERIVADQQRLPTQHLDHLVMVDELGIYWILCAMKRLTAELGETTETQHSRDSIPEEFRQIESEATRQLRDYTVLRSLQGLLQRIEMENQVMARGTAGRRHRRRRHPARNASHADRESTVE